MGAATPSLLRVSLLQVSLLRVASHDWASAAEPDLAAGDERVLWRDDPRVLWRDDPRLLWRDDPRPPGDFPSGVAPQEWRPSRRALRRANRRGIQLEPPVDSPPARPAAPPALPSASRATATPRPLPARVVPPASEPRVAASGPAPLAAPAATAEPLVHRSQAYGSHVRQRFDIYLPADCAGGGLPLVIWIPGSDWKTVSRDPCPVAWLVDRGYAVASIGYRTSDMVTFPAPLEDCRAAVIRLARDAEIWGIDPTRIAVVGAAAGGHLAALVGLSDWPAAPVTESTADPASVETPDRDLVAAIAAVGAASHLPTLGGGSDRGSSAASRLVGGPLPEVREAALAASPLTHVSPQAPPTLLVHGLIDTVVPVDQAIRLDKALVAAGVDSTLVLIAGGHDASLSERSPAGTAVGDFLDRVLQPTTAPR
jgi:acetyl esterase/lipase